jgi:SAM-dependent methyltransferase
MTFLDAIRDSYDTVAADYVKIIRGPEKLDPITRAVLNGFADMLLDAGCASAGSEVAGCASAGSEVAGCASAGSEVAGCASAGSEVAGRGPVADLGCGPGWFTNLLAERGLDAFGVDLSPGMIEQARTAFPHLRFEVGSMTALDIPDASLGGVLAFFSTHHTPPEYLPVLYAEFHRVLAPGGLLLLAGHVGPDLHYSPTQAYGGNPVSYESHLVPLGRIADLLAAAGFTVTTTMDQPNDGERRHGLVIAEAEPARPAEPAGATG